MDIKKYRQVRVIILLFIGAIIAVSVFLDIYLLAAISIFTGILFLSLVRLKTRITIDEREQTIREKAAQLTYAIFAPTIGLGSFFLLIPYQKLSPVFAKGEFLYLE